MRNPRCDHAPCEPCPFCENGDPCDAPQPAARGLAEQGRLEARRDEWLDRVTLGIVHHALELRGTPNWHRVELTWHDEREPPGRCRSVGHGNSYWHALDEALKRAER
jgi:hypothetical protein